MQRSRGGFSLIELLVALAVIAVLLSLLVPGLRMARKSAREMVCQSNLKQLNAAWQMYVGDFRVFPVPRSKDIEKWIEPGRYPRPGAPAGLMSSVMWSWGGVHWYGSKPDGTWTTPMAAADPLRPVNPYVERSQVIRDKARVFCCPLDNGSFDSFTDRQNLWVKVGPAAGGGVGGAPGTTVYEQLGTSYDANDWLYCRAGARMGLEVEGDDKASNFIWWQGPQHVVTTPSRLVMLGDSGVMLAGRYPIEYLMQTPKRSGWWHGVQIGNLTFLDGSVRRERMGEVTTATYTFYLDESKHAGLDGKGRASYRVTAGHQ
ncbi:MAG: type II secretion system protein [Planctomycetes bacterium]|nr:type II secretion system protein [Planctomycetota bacterium]